MMTTYWHIAHPSYAGGDLLCRDRLPEGSEAFSWAWDEAPEGFDGDVICLFPDTPRGRTEADWLWSERDDCHLLRVDLPDDVQMTRVEEGYPAVIGRISADYITVVHTGYAPNVARREGDAY